MERSSGDNIQLRFQRLQHSSSRFDNRSPTFCHLRFNRVEPDRIRSGIANQYPVSLLHRLFISTAMPSMSWLQSKNQPIKKPSPCSSTIDKKSIHGRSEPDSGQPFGQIVDGCIRAIDPHLAPVRLSRFCSGADADAIKFGGNRKSAIPGSARHLRKGCTTQTPTGHEKRYRLQYIGFSRAVRSVQCDKLSLRPQCQSRMIAEVSQGQGRKRHWTLLLYHDPHPSTGYFAKYRSQYLGYFTIIYNVTTLTIQSEITYISVI